MGNTYLSRNIINGKKRYKDAKFGGLVEKNPAESAEIIIDSLKESHHNAIASKIFSYETKEEKQEKQEGPRKKANKLFDDLAKVLKKVPDAFKKLEKLKKQGMDPYLDLKVECAKKAIELLKKTPDQKVAPSTSGTDHDRLITLKVQEIEKLFVDVGWEPTGGNHIPRTADELVTFCNDILSSEKFSKDSEKLNDEYDRLGKDYDSLSGEYTKLQKEKSDYEKEKSKYEKEKNGYDAKVSSYGRDLSNSKSKVVDLLNDVYTLKSAKLEGKKQVDLIFDVDGRIKKLDGDLHSPDGSLTEVTEYGMQSYLEGKTNLYKSVFNSERSANTNENYPSLKIKPPKDHADSVWLMDVDAGHDTYETRLGNEKQKDVFDCLKRGAKAVKALNTEIKNYNKLREALKQNQLNKQTLDDKIKGIDRNIKDVADKIQNMNEKMKIDKATQVDIEQKSKYFERSVNAMKREFDKKILELRTLEEEVQKNKKDKDSDINGLIIYSKDDEILRELVSIDDIDLLLKDIIKPGKKLDLVCKDEKSRLKARKSFLKDIESYVKKREGFIAEYKKPLEFITQTLGVLQYQFLSTVKVYVKEDDYRVLEAKYKEVQKRVKNFTYYCDKQISLLQNLENVITWVFHVYIVHCAL